MKKTLLLSTLLLFTCSLFAQLNVSLVGQRSYTDELNDIWGYVAPDSTEYAIVGLTTGVSVVSLANPAMPTEVAFFTGDFSIWRDIKTWGTFAYVTTDTGDDGLMVIDLTDVNNITASLWQPTLTLPNGSGTLERAHNIYIDNGYAYVSGHNISNSGVMILDVHTTPGTPIYVGAADIDYSHDCYARNDTLYSGDINAGYFSVYDVTNKAAPVQLATQTTPNNFTHNVWLSDDSKTLFTTDEVANGYVGSYDVSDLNNIKELDRFQPLATLGTGVIPHNVHVWDDWLLISYYSDGLIVVDAARPDNLIEVGYFDTYLSNGAGFNGSWGAYPFLPSGLVIVSDINSGLYVFQPTYVRACYIEGQVTDAQTNATIPNANIEILTTLINEPVSLLGEYKTGVATSGSYDVVVSAPGYASDIATLSFANGVVLVHDVQLTPLTAFAFTGTVVQSSDASPIDNAKIIIENSQFTFDLTSDATGGFDTQTFYAGTYDVYAAKWGYKTKLMSGVTFNGAPNNFTVTLDEGYQDEFLFDLGWTTVATASTGDWELGEPIGINYQGNPATPGEDINNDLGDKCYVTGNGGNSAGANDVDNGIVRLNSPTFDMSNYQNGYISYYTWFFNDGGNGGAPDDALVVKLSDGTTLHTVETITASDGAWRGRSLIKVDSFFTPTANMRIVFETSDLQGSGHLVEAGVDLFQAFDSIAVNTTPVLDMSINIDVFPNPTVDYFQVTYNLEQLERNTFIRIYDALGRLVESMAINSIEGKMNIGNDLENGVYFINIESDSFKSEPAKVVKMK